MISYEEYLNALPAWDYTQCFYTILDARIDAYLVKNPELLPVSRDISAESGSYCIPRLETLESSIQKDNLLLALFIGPDGEWIDVTVPASIAHESGYEQYLQLKDEADIVLTYMQESLNRVNEYVKKNPSLLPSWVALWKKGEDGGHYAGFRSPDPIEPNDKGSVFTDVMHTDDNISNMIADKNRVCFVFEVPFDVVKD